MPPLPQEILDVIIDDLKDDHLSLRACALTQRSWLRRSRMNIHRSVLIGDSAKWSRFKDLLSSNTELGPLYREFHLDLEDGVFEGPLSRLSPGPSTLRNVCTLSITGAMRSNVLSSGAAAVLTSDFPRLQILIMRKCALRFCRFVSRFPMLRVLKLTYCFSLDKVPGTSLPPLVPPNLEELVIGDANVEAMFVSFRWFLGHPVCLENLHTMTMYVPCELRDVDRERHFPTVSQFLRQLGPALRFLTLVDGLANADEDGEAYCIN